MDVKYTAVYRGENAPRRTDVLWVHHSVKNDLTSPIVVQSFSKGCWVDAYDKEDQSDIERLTEQLGDITTLETTAQNSVVSAINEVVGNTGDLDDLTTTEKTTLVGAINEAATSGDPASLLYTAQTLTDAQQAQARANVGAASEAELQALNSGEVVPVASLPTASADTMGKVYLVGPDANSEYDRYVSSYDGTDYTWVQIGTTEMDLSGYATDAELSELEHKVDGLEMVEDGDAVALSLYDFKDIEDALTLDGTAGYYDATGTFNADSNYKSGQVTVNPNCTYWLYGRKYSSSAGLLALDENNNVLFSIDDYRSKAFRFSSRVKKLLLSTYKNWDLSVTSLFNRYDRKGAIEKMLNKKTGNNIFDINSAKSAMLIKNGAGDSNYPTPKSTATAYRCVEIYNLEGQTSLTASSGGSLGASSYSLFDKNGAFLRKGKITDASPTVDVTGAWIIYLNLYKDDELMVNWGNTALPYEPYKEYYDITVAHSKTVDDTNFLTPVFSTLGSQKATATTATLNDGNLSISDFPQYLKKSHTVTVDAKITAFNEIVVGIGYGNSRGSQIRITTDKIYFQDGAKTSTAGSWSNTAHGLTIDAFIKVLYKVSIGRLDYIVSTKGGYFKGYYENNSLYLENYGKPFVSADANTTLTDVVLGGTSDDFKHPVWVIGDSMVSVFDNRWPYYVLKEFGFKNWLLQGLAGGTSADLYADLQKSLAFGCPKYLVWMLGANDLDNDYKSYLDTVLAKCEELNITPILLMFPDFYGMAVDEKKSSAVKNAYMLAKNVRYINLRKAVSSSITQVIGDYTVNIWYGDDYSQPTPPDGSFIGSDRVHPTILGAKSEGVQFVTDFPEILQY